MAYHLYNSLRCKKKTVEFSWNSIIGDEGPSVYPVLTKEGQNIGYVQLVKIEKGWEIEYQNTTKNDDSCQKTCFMSKKPCFMQQLLFVKRFLIELFGR